MEPDKKKIATSVLPIIILLNYVFLYFKKEPIMSFQELLSGIKSPGACLTTILQHKMPLILDYLKNPHDTFQLLAY